MGSFNFVFTVHCEKHMPLGVVCEYELLSEEPD